MALLFHHDQLAMKFIPILVVYLFHLIRTHNSKLMLTAIAQYFRYRCCKKNPVHKAKKPVEEEPVVEGADKKKDSDGKRSGL